MFTKCFKTLCLILPCFFCACDEDDVADTPVQVAQTRSMLPKAEPERPKSPDPATIELTVSELTRCAAVSAAVGAKRRLTMEGLPKNTRQTAEGYWIGSIPTPEHIEEFHARNVRLVLTASLVPAKKLQALKQTMASLGITHIYMPFGSRFPSPSKFLPIVERFAPDQIFIHCEHGGDRSGAILAYLLNQRHGWQLARSLYAVIVPSYGDIQALTRILNAHGIACSADEFENDIGIYSAESNGGYGGLKVYAKDGNYVKLVNTLIDTVHKQKRDKRRRQ